MSNELKNLWTAVDCRKKIHGYQSVYSKALDRKKPIRLLEVGILRGASIDAWLQYLPEAEIFAIDTFQRVPAKYVGVLDHPRVKYWAGESQRFRLPKGWPSSFDIVIDDGCHDPAVQLATFQSLFPFCRGTYFLEDVSPTKAGFSGLTRGLPANAVHHDLRKGRHSDSYIIEVPVKS